DVIEHRPRDHPLRSAAQVSDVVAAGKPASRRTQLGWPHPHQLADLCDVHCPSLLLRLTSPPHGHHPRGTGAAGILRGPPDPFCRPREDAGDVRPCRTGARRRILDRGTEAPGWRAGSAGGPVRRRVICSAGAGAAAGYLALQWLGRTYGAARAERRRRLPGDELTPDPMAVTTHAITIGAPAGRIWPRLGPMGWHPRARYTPRWVERLL